MRTTEENFALHKELWTWVADNQHMLATKWDWPGFEKLGLYRPAADCFLCDEFSNNCPECPLSVIENECQWYNDFNSTKNPDVRRSIALKITNVLPREVMI